MQQHRALILRSNRFLGSSLVEKGLVSTADLEAANEKFMESIQSPELLKNASILTTLVYALKALDETKVLELLVEEHGMGLIDLDFMELASLGAMGIDSSACWATSTIPFGKVEGMYLLASCYYMSAPAVKYWEELLNHNIIWYGTSTASMMRGLERLEEMQAAEAAAAAEEEEDAV